MNPITYPLLRGRRGQAVADLHDALSVLVERGILSIPGRELAALEEALGSERDRNIYGEGTAKAVSLFQTGRGLDATGEIDAHTAEGINAFIVEPAPQPQPAEPPSSPELVPQSIAATFTIAGKVISRYRAGVGGLTVRIVDRDANPAVPLALQDTTADGTFRISFTPGERRRPTKRALGLQAHVYRGNDLLAVTDIRYNAGAREMLNIVLDEKASAALPTEYETLLADLTGHFTGRLYTLEETETRTEITDLARRTGWDARAIALAGLADGLSAQAALSVEIPPAFFYALLRAGLPAEEDLLYRTSVRTVKAVWEQAAAQGVIPGGQEAIAQAAQRFRNISAERILTSRAPVGVSSLQEMLTASGLNDDQSLRFAALAAEHGDDWAGFWQEAANIFTPQEIRRLQLDGKLSFLTLNNAQLMSALQTNGGIADLAQLAQSGFCRPEGWEQALRAVPIPEEIPGEGEVQKTNYAKFLAAQLRLAYPTLAVAEMVNSEKTHVAAGMSHAICDFLTREQGRFEDGRFDIGLEPVERYVRRKQLVIDPAIQTEIGRIQRIYQITPSDVTMNALLDRGIDSAFAVIRRDRDTFIQAYKDAVGGEETARLIYDRAEQVHNAVLNIATAYLTASTAPEIGVHSPPKFLQAKPGALENASDVIAYPTLEGLFGSMDYYSCDHSRSILSPAAYLVDLLMFLHADEKAWADYCDVWQREHGGAAYPFSSPAALDPGVQTNVSPADVLFSRRPDIQYLPLTGENTDTALPYIDVVNETLEFFVANGTLSPARGGAYQGHDTGGASTEDLLASPQFVDNAAYDALRQAGFPAPLPFDWPLEVLRRYFQKFDTPLVFAMERLRNSNAVGGTGGGYGWRDIWMEELGLSRAEYSILTDFAAVPLWKMYGFPESTANGGVIAGVPDYAGLSNAKQFCRRIGVTYDDLFALLKSRFVNPASALIPKLERLGVSFSDLKRLKDRDTPDADREFLDLLPIGPHAPDRAAYDGNIPKWVKDQENYAGIMSLVVLAIPAVAWTTGTRYEVGACVRSTTLPDDSTLYYVCKVAGISGQQPPDWPTIAGRECSDGSIVWRCQDESMAASFDDLAFRYADPARAAQNVDPAVFVRLLRFVRLRKKLGWTTEQTDAAICALFRRDGKPAGAGDVDSVAKLDGAFRDHLLPRLGIIGRLLKVLNLKAGRDLFPLLACWSEIGTWGRNALYRQLFLNPALIKQDALFDDNGYGEFLATVSVPYRHPQAELEPRVLEAANGLAYDDGLKRLLYTGELDRPTYDRLKNLTGMSRDFRDAVDHLYAAGRLSAHSEVVRSAFNLTGDEYDRIIASLRYGNSTALTIPVVSRIFRYGWLARKLRLSIRELLLLEELTGLDAFAPPDPADPAILRLIEFVQDLKDSSLKLPAALYLIWNQDLSGKSAPAFEQVASFARALRTALAAGATESEVAGDPDAGALVRERKAQQVLQMASSSANVDRAFAQALLTAAAPPYPLHARGNPAEPALYDFLALGSPGPPIEFTPSVSLWTGYLEAPETGTFNIYIKAGADAGVSMAWGGKAYNMAPGPSGWHNTESLELRAGTLYPVVLTVRNVHQEARVLWEWTPKGQGATVIPARCIYPGAAFDAFRQAYVRFLKAASLAAGLGLSAPEIAHFAVHEDYRIDSQGELASNGQGWLNALPDQDNLHLGQPQQAAAARTLNRTLLTPLRALLDYSRIRAALSAKSDSLLLALRNPAQAAAGPDGPLYAMTRWDAASLKDLLGHFHQYGGDISGLSHLGLFRRVFDAFTLVRKLGIPARALIRATTNTPDAETVRDLLAALRTRYDPASWRQVIRPINDEMRNCQRDALVAYILQKMRASPATKDIDTADKLFEYFLMDVQMEPMVETSRIRHALSSVQLFIERCLMNLEPRVAAEAIVARRWEWMKRYRVWEANRKVFLQPENWLEPELRDKVSPFCKEALGELLQSDIDEDRATNALLNYLSKLEEVAKLEPCGIHHIPGTEIAGEVDHVIARTSGAHRKYYYRRYERGGWTPWEQVKLDIEDNPVIPVVWNGRLLLFWLRLLKETPIKLPKAVDPITLAAGPDQERVANLTAKQLTTNMVSTVQTDVAGKPADNVTVNVKAILCWSEYYNGKWQATKTSGVNAGASDATAPLDLGPCLLAALDAFRSSLWLSIAEVPTQTGRAALRVQIRSGPDTSASASAPSFLLYNTHSLPLSNYVPPDAAPVLTKTRIRSRSFDAGTQRFNISYVHGKTNSPLECPVAKPMLNYSTIQPHHPGHDPWYAPFFFEDSHHVFFVTTTDEPPLPSLYQGYAVAVITSVLPQAMRIPPLVLKTDLVENRPVLKDPGVVDPASISRFVTEDVYIHRAFDTGGAVMYGGRPIGPAGTVFQSRN